MTIDHMDLANLYVEKGGSLERRFLGAVLHMTTQMLHGGYTPDGSQLAWANAMKGADLGTHVVCARAAMEWALVTNATIQADPLNCSDGDLDYVVAEFARTFGG